MSSLCTFVLFFLESVCRVLLDCFLSCFICTLLQHDHRSVKEQALWTAHPYSFSCYTTLQAWSSCGNHLVYFTSPLCIRVSARVVLTTTLMICSSFRTKSTFFCVVSEARTALWLLQASLALSYESFAVMNFRQEFPTRCQLSPHTFSGMEGTDEELALCRCYRPLGCQWGSMGAVFLGYTPSFSINLSSFRHQSSSKKGVRK